MNPSHPLFRFFSIVVVIAFAFTLPAMGATADSSARFHPGRILVKPRADVSPRALDELHASGRRRVVRTFRRQGNLQVIELNSGERVPEAITRYRSSGLVQFAEPDYVVRAQAVPNDPKFQDGTQWWLNNIGQNGGLADADIDAPEAWDVQSSADSVVVAVIDTGIRATHEDLAANLWVNPDDGSHGFNALTGGHDPVDDNGHGTHLSGLIGAVGNNGVGVSGVAWNVKIMACKFLDQSGDGFNSDAVACIEFAQTNGARVLNLSWGGPEFSESVSNAIWSLRADGIIVVAAAGNGTRDTDVEPFYPASLPVDNIVAVGASTSTDTRWPSSSYGATNVDLFAPGAAMYSTSRSSDSAYSSSSGSSWSAGVVSGAMALLRQKYPNASYKDVIQRIFSAVDVRPAFVGYCVTGGRLNLRKALDQPGIQLLPGSLPVELRVTGIPAHEYAVEIADDLGTWLPGFSGISDSNGEWHITDEDSTNATSRFYRAVAAP